MKKTVFYFILFCFSTVQAQIGIGTDTPDTSSILDLSPASNNKGLLVPRITEAQRDAISSPANGLLIFQTNNVAGFYYYSTSSSSWLKMGLTSEVNEYGDIKTGIQGSDHNGWVKLDGRLKSSLTASQQARATALGIGTNLPDADNAFLVQNGNTLGQVSGSNSKNISQANLPNVNFNTTTSSNGNHSHSVDPPNTSTSTNGDHIHGSNASGGNNPGLAYRSGARTTTGYDNSSGELDEVYTAALYIYNNGNHTHTVDIAAFNSSTSGSHDHTVTVNSGGSGTALDITPKSLSINTFIFLGN